MIFCKNQKDIEINLPDIDSHVSEMLVKRDSFFHSCWMILKSRRSDIWDDMAKIELYVSGHDDPTVSKETDEKGNDKSNSTIL